MSDDVEKKAEKKPSKKDEKIIKNTIEVNPTLKEQTEKTVVLGWGRMNPVTVGHEKLANKIKSVAKKSNATPLIYLTHSHDPKKNPLKYDDKVTLAKKAFGRDVVQKSKSKTIIQVMQELDGKYDNVIVVVGQDRIAEFEKLLTKYNGKDYTFDSIKIVSAGDRDPDAEGVEGMSASKMRAAAASGKKDDFMSGLPKALQRDGEKVYDMVRSGMNINEEVDLEEDREPMTRTQRRNMAIAMRRNKSKIAAGRRRAANRKPTPEKIKIRANKRARDIIKKKVIGKSGMSYDELSDSQKQMIDKKVMKRQAAIKRLAKKLIPKIRSEELDINAAFTLNEDFETLVERKTPQDDNIKDMEGTQPKKYYSGVKKSEKDDRARHFAKGAKMDDDNPAAYKPAPGDEDAETKPSKHTKKYKEMFDEASENDVKPRKRYHNLLNSNGTPKIDMRFKAFRAKKPMTEEFENDTQVINLIDNIWESVELEESKTDAALQKKADKTEISKSILKNVYDRGVAAWRTGHRPGTTPAQWGMARVNSFVTKGKGTWGKADSDLAAKVRSEEVELDSFFDLNEQLELTEASILDKALAAVHKHVLGGTELGDIAYQVSRARGVDMSGRELEKAYVSKYGKPDTDKKVNPELRARLMKKYSVKEEHGAGDEGTDKLTKKYKKDTPGEDMNESFDSLMEAECQLIGMKQIKQFEKVVDELFKKFDIDFNFTKHFGERMSDGRNTPCITLKELAAFIKKIYAKQGKSIKGVAGAEAVIKDIQSDLNIPVAVTYDSKNDEFDVAMKTIMRKKNFKSPDKVITY